MGQTGMAYITFHSYSLNGGDLLLHSNSGKIGKYSIVVCPKIRRCFDEQLTVSATIPEEPLSFTLLSCFCTNSHRCIVMFSTIPLISVFSISSFVSYMFI